MSEGQPVVFRSTCLHSAPCNHQSSVLCFSVLLFGVLLGVIQSLLDQLPQAGVHAVFEAYVVPNIAVLGIFSAQSELFGSSNFVLLVVTVLLITFLKMPRSRIFSTRRRLRAIYGYGFVDGHVLSKGASV